MTIFSLSMALLSYVFYAWLFSVSPSWLMWVWLTLTITSIPVNLVSGYRVYGVRGVITNTLIITPFLVLEVLFLRG